MRSVGSVFGACWAAAGVYLAASAPALAQVCYPFGCNAPSGAPGPLIGVGLPLAGAALVSLMIVRRFRRKN